MPLSDDIPTLIYKDALERRGDRGAEQRKAWKAKRGLDRVEESPRRGPGRPPKVEE